MSHATLYCENYECITMLVYTCITHLRVTTTTKTILKAQLTGTAQEL